MRINSTRKSIMEHSALIILTTLIITSSINLPINAQYRTEKKSTILSDHALVQRAIGGFVYGIKHNMPGVSYDYYLSDRQQEENDQIGVSESLFYRAIRSMKQLDNKPIITIVKPKIIVTDNSAIVDCYVIWEFINDNNEIIRVKSKEIFIMAKSNGKYKIIESNITPHVLKYYNNRASLEKAIQECASREK